MLLLIDNSHGLGEYPIKNYLKSLKIPYKVITSASVLDDYPKEKVSRVILSGGPLLLTDREYFSKFNMNIKALLKYDCPILGICFGFQVMCMAYGGSLKRLDKQFCQVQEIHAVDPTVFHLQKFGAQFCCNDVLRRLPHEFESIATAHIQGKDRVVAMKNSKGDRIGMLFHPEELESTHEILGEWLEN